MPTQQGQPAAADAGRFAWLRFLPTSLILASARAAGRATRISRDVASATVRSVGQVACTTRRLNPFAWLKPQDGKPTAKSGPPLARATPTLPPPPNAVPRSAPPRPSVRAAVPAQVVRPPVAQKAAEPVPAPKPRRVDSRRPQPTSAPRGTSFADVTPEEASAAAFNSVTEKVSFARALKDLASPDSAMRARAATVMGTVAHDLSVRALTTCLARDPAAEVRKVCVHALTELGKREGLPAVERALSDSSANVRVAAVRGVYRLAGPVGASLLVQMLSDADEGVRRRAAVCIGWLGRPELTAELLPLLRSGSAWVRLATLEALENLKSLTAVDYVIALLQDPEESVQRKAFDVLRTITGRQMGETFPADEKGRQFMIARWRSWREDSRKRGAAGLA